MPKPSDTPRNKKKDIPPPPPAEDPSPPPQPEPDPGTTPSVNGRIVVDPITRIEGHLKIETEVADGKVTGAWSTGTLFRGIETILKGRNPEDAWLFTQRLCGVCTYVHGSSSVRCVEDAAGVIIPENARIIRNLLMGAQYLHDHPVHFYHLHALDWVDIVSALSADPVVTADTRQTIVTPGTGKSILQPSKHGCRTLSTADSWAHSPMPIGDTRPIGSLLRKTCFSPPIIWKRSKCRPKPPGFTPSSAVRIRMCRACGWAASPAAMTSTVAA